jgi:uncharacterized protein
MSLLTLYECTIGSKAYGLETPESDLDIRAIAIEQDLSYHFGLKIFECSVDQNQEDYVVWSLAHYAKLLAANNTQMLEMLFSEPDMQLNVHPSFKTNFLDNKELFLNKSIYNTITGYARSEHQRTLGETTGKLGERRKEAIDQFGYSPRNASHCIRLLYMGEKALKDREIHVKLPENIRLICMALKTGIASRADYEFYYNYYSKAIDEAIKISTLPDKIDNEWLNSLIVKTSIDALQIKVN